jgi:hypothetical protein
LADGTQNIVTTPSRQRQPPSMHNSQNNIVTNLKGTARKEFVKGVNAAIISNKASVEATMHAYRTTKEHGGALGESLYHIGMAVNVVQADFAILLERYLLSSRDYEKKLYARILAVTIIEFLDDVNNLLGKDLVQELEKLGFKKYVPKLKEINKNLSAFKKSHGKLLREIRNTAMAHKAKSAEVLYKSVYLLDHQSICEVAIRVYAISNQFNFLSVDISNHFSNEYRRLSKWFDKIPGATAASQNSG